MKINIKNIKLYEMEELAKNFEGEVKGDYLYLKKK